MITIHVPFGSNPIDLNKELSSARNIKERSVRQSTIKGLSKIASYL